MGVFSRLFPALQFILFCMLTAGCNSGTYVATHPYAPDLRQAGDAEIAGGAKLRFIGEIICPEVDVGFSPISHLGIMGSYRRDFKSTFSAGSGRQGSRQPYFGQELWEIGIGSYFKQDGDLFGFYGGYSNGWASRRDDYIDMPYRKWNDDLDLKFHRFWLQLQAFFPVTRGVHLGFVGRGSLHRFDEVSSPQNMPLEQDLTAQNYGLADAAVLIQVNGKYTQVLIHTGLSMPTHKELSEHAHLLFGIQLGLHRPRRQL